MKLWTFKIILCVKSNKSWQSFTASSVNFNWKLKRFVCIGTFFWSFAEMYAEAHISNEPMLQSDILSVFCFVFIPNSAFQICKTFILETQIKCFPNCCTTGKCDNGTTSVGYWSPVPIRHRYLCNRYVLEPNKNADFGASFRCHAWAIGWNICPLFLRNGRKKHHHWHRTWKILFSDWENAHKLNLESSNNTRPTNLL